MATSPKNKTKDTPDVLVCMLHPVRHDGQDYSAGEALELAPADATRLIAAGYAEPARRDPDELSLA